MIQLEQLHDSTEIYLKTLISEVTGAVGSDFDSFAQFGDLGVDSFYVLKVVRRLEADFGPLSKSLLFEYFTIHDLAKYFVEQHEQTLLTRFPGQALHAASPNGNGRHERPLRIDENVAGTSAQVADIASSSPAPMRILESKAFADASLRTLLESIYELHKRESSVSRGTRKIAPNLFIGREKRGFLNYGRFKKLVLVYAYTGPEEYLPQLLEQMYLDCISRGLDLHIMADREILSVGHKEFSATPFGVLQRVAELRRFSLEGGSMRRLRYQISKFTKAGAARTVEYSCGSSSEIDREIAAIIDEWCESKTQVNPLVYEVKQQILAGAIEQGHRLFLSYLDDVLQNVILITALCADQNGYLMDLEFYRQTMPPGGLEFTIINMIAVLVGEGCNLLSLGATLGCKLGESVHADPEVDRLLNDLRAQNIFNDEGNFQFKNKFRPINSGIFLCRPAGCGNPDSAIDVIMMIADPLKNQTLDDEGFCSQAVVSPLASRPGKVKVVVAETKQSSAVEPPETLVAGSDRAAMLSKFGFNPANIPHEHVDFDLKTDSWSQLRMPTIRAYMSALHGQLQQTAQMDETLRSVFPFFHFVLTESGQAAERVFFKAWPKAGVVLQNLLFPSTIYHEIDNGFTPRELPDSEVFVLNSGKASRAQCDLDAFRAAVTRDPDAIAMACIEVCNNASGGSPVSPQHLREVKAILAPHSIPLVLDITRILENAQLLIEQDASCKGKSIWGIAKETLLLADAVIGSLTKDFCIAKGGIIATNDSKLFQRLNEVADQVGSGVDLIDTKLITRSLLNGRLIESRIGQRVQAVGRIWQALRDNGVPVVHPVGGHCVLIDVKQMCEFEGFRQPVASFLSWIYLNTGIRGAAHSVGMQKKTSLNDLVRLAIPLGMEPAEIDELISRLLKMFARKVNVPEIVPLSSAPQPLGGLHADYRLIAYHAESIELIQQAKAKPDASRAGAAAPDVPPPLTPESRSAEQPSMGSRSKKNAESPVESGHAAPEGGPFSGQEIAIVGMAGRYPKAKNLDELWQNLVRAKDCVEVMPESRYALRPKPSASGRYRGGFLEDIDKFDPTFFNISPREAAMLDPQERQFLEVAWEAIEDAGYYPESLAAEDDSRKVGVFVGAVWATYQMFAGEADQASKRIAPNSFLWSIANRVSYWMNFSGPSLTLDTACSSSLTALYLACAAIQSGECSGAIVGGVNLDLHDTKLEINAGSGALSKDGVCRSFGKDANGYVAGEGVGALFLKPVKQALCDQDNIYGVIKSTVANHGGRTSGYTVPNPKAQADLVSAALVKANIDARSISYIEAHGTGTALGDPIEISGLNAAFQPYGVAHQTCAVGSIKSNIGHLEAAAGVVGVSKVLLQMKHRQLVPSLHSSQLNELIEFEKSPFYVVQRLEEWKGREVDGVRTPLRAGISSFGAGGANAHVILESYEETRAEEGFALDYIHVFPLSARTEEQLRDVAMRLAQALIQTDCRLADIAYTLRVGRKSFDHRLAISAANKEQLLDKLGCFLAGKKCEGVSSGHEKNWDSIARLLNKKEKEEFIELLSRRRTPSQIAQLWADGLFADLGPLESDRLCRRVSLPTYPFADKRHWAAIPSAASSVSPAAGIHAMVDSNESTFERQIYKKTFHNKDFFIHDHHVSKVPTLPGMAYLEFARKTGELSAGRKVQRIKNVVWVSPIAISGTEQKEVFIELKVKDTTARFEVFSYDKGRKKMLHCQGILLYATQQEQTAPSEFIDLPAIRSRCSKAIDREKAYAAFESAGLALGPSFQVLQEVYKNDTEILGVLTLPELRRGDLDGMPLHPSLMDGALQAGMGAHLGEELGEMYVPFSIGEVEILHPLRPNCFSYATEMWEDRDGNKASTRYVKSDVLIADESGRVLVKIHESLGIPLREVHKSPVATKEPNSTAALYYQYDWEFAPLVLQAGAQEHPVLLMFEHDDTLAALYRERLLQAGQPLDRVFRIRPGSHFSKTGNQSYEIDPASRKDYSNLLQSLSGRRIDGICFAWPMGRHHSLEDAGLQKTLAAGVYPFLFLCQALVEQKIDNASFLYLYSVRSGEPQPADEAMSGFIKSLRLEHPKLLSKTLEIQADNDEKEQILDAVLQEVQATKQDSAAVRYKSGERYVRKLSSFDLNTPSGTPSVEFREDGVYLITGGAGGLGLIFADFLVKKYKANVVLTGRSELSAQQQEKLGKLEGFGGHVLYFRGDIGRREDVERHVSGVRSRFGRINGIIHSAGVLRDSYLRHKKVDEMVAVLGPKVYGTIYLDELTRRDNLDFLVLFSSVAAIAGNAGQCDYSYANHFMDSFADAREKMRARGERAGKTLSLNWSLWADGGMKMDEQTETFVRNTLGIKPISIATGIEAVKKGLAQPRSQFVVVEGVREKIEVAWGLRPKEAPNPTPQHMSQSQPSSGKNSGDSLDLTRWLEDELAEMVMRFLKLDADDVVRDKILLDLGFDSIGLTTFANSINEKFELEITPVLFFDYPSIAEIAKNLATEKRQELLKFFEGMQTGAGQSAPPVTEPNGMARVELPDAPQESIASKGWNPHLLDEAAAEPIIGSTSASSRDLSPEMRFVNQPIAIVGMSAVMPQSDDADEFWENLKSARDLITLIPEERWSWQEYYGDPFKEPNKSRSKWGGFMKDIFYFDPLFFGISPREAQMMDPQQRIFLETVWRTIEDSGQRVSDLSGTKTGLFVGAAGRDYVDLMNNLDIALDGYSASGNSHSVLANRVSFLLNLRGPSAPIDTACSSSLVALHRAIESIHTGSCSAAIVGGVQTMLTPAGHISFGMAGMLSDDGKCKTFDKRANGYVRGEGCAAILIKPLAAAEADGNHIYAVVKATAENHGGRVTTLTAPNSAAQTALLIEAYQKAHIDPTTVGYIECHGTGTSLGDPIEIQSLGKAFAELYKQQDKPPAQVPHCGLSSVKTNIGHLETAAGIAGIVKVLLAIKNKAIPANINFEEVNPYIDLKGTPFFIADRLTPWEAPKDDKGCPVPRRAGVSSFGFGGANAHVVLEEYPVHERPKAEGLSEVQLFVLSAKDEARLAAYAHSLGAFLDRAPVDMADLAYTLQVGRDEMTDRLAFVAADLAEVRAALEQIQDQRTPTNCYRSNIRSKIAKAFIADHGTEAAFHPERDRRQELARVAELWVSGASVNWSALHLSYAPRRISAPTYPFAREYHRIEGHEGRTMDTQRGQAHTTAAYLHPLIHRNISTLAAQKFATCFTGKEFFLADHKIGEDALLPAVCYIEMIAAAGELAGGESVRYMRDMVLMTPLLMRDAPREVELSLASWNGEVEYSIASVGNVQPGIHCRGRLGYSDTSLERNVRNIEEIRGECASETISGKDMYDFIATSGLHLGRSFQVVQEIYASRSQCLILLRLPEHLKQEADRFQLHPVIVDGAFHTAITMVKKAKPEIPWAIPFSIKEIQVNASLKDVRYAHATWDADAVKDESAVIRINIEFLDKHGVVLVKMHDLGAKPLLIERSKIDGEQVHRVGSNINARLGEDIKGSEESLHLVPVWNRVTSVEGDLLSPSKAKLLCLRSQGSQLEWIRTSFPDAEELQLAFNASVSEIDERLFGSTFDELLWIAPDLDRDKAQPKGQRDVLEQQQAGVLFVFRTIKALLQLGFGSKNLAWTFITGSTQSVFATDQVNSEHSGIFGLVGSLAKEYPNWTLRLLDLDSLDSVSAAECLSRSRDRQGDGLAYRRGDWFFQGLGRLREIPRAASVYRKDGIYVVIGGAGGVGGVWSRYMAEHYQARLVWIGRSPCDATIQQKIDSLAQYGPSPLYISADATSFADLQRALALVHEVHPVIHGLVHSAIVLHDQSIARVQEEEFRAVYFAKAAVGVNIDRVFGDLPLDFMLFFSSAASFSRSPGQSSYSAGCTFKDSLAQKLHRERPYPVKIMNWGYWGSVGAVADESHKELMRRIGIGSIEAEEGMSSLSALMEAAIPQMAFIKTLTSEVTASLKIVESITDYPKDTPSVLEKVREEFNDYTPVEPQASLERELPTAEMNDLASEILASSLLSLGLFTSGARTLKDLHLEKPCATYYERWLDSSICYLTEQHWLNSDLTFTKTVRELRELWNEWNDRTATWSSNTSLQAQIALFEACLRGLPGILSGTLRATDVIFPNSSMALVEGVYRGNTLADGFNQALCDTLSVVVERMLQDDSSREIRIIEIGAGTGGTTAKLLPMLGSLRVAEYCYTDISKAFLMYGEKQFKPQFAHLTTSLFDASRNATGQSVPLDRFDIAIAANVLHATADIRETLRNVKAVLRNSGVLLLNEISNWSLFSHMTFGLLEGWWLHQDTVLRLPGSPGLTSESWQQVLEEEGFEDVFFPAAKMHSLGQQIVVAASDGWVRQRVENISSVSTLSRQAAPAANPLGAIERGKGKREVVQSQRSTEVREQMGLEYIRSIILEKLSGALKIDSSTLRDDAPLAEYGVDSIIGVDLVRTMNEALHIDLETISLFEHSTIEALSQHIWSRWGTEIASRTGQSSEPQRRPAEKSELGESRSRFFTPVKADGAGHDASSVSRSPSPTAPGVMEPIAVIGMSGRFAKSESLDAFWDNLASGNDLIEPVSRWHAEDCVTSNPKDTQYCSKGSFIDSIDRFDAAFFRIPAAEAEYMDPQQRVFLEESWKALEDAGYAGQGVSEAKCGVYVGCGTSGYGTLFDDEPPAQAFWGNAQSIVPARIAYHLNLQGPALAVDTACSSSLVSVHLACQGLWSGEIEMAVAGGICLHPTPAFYHVANRAHMLSPEGECRSFDAKANGFVPGEGVGVVVLKRLSDAVRDGDHIHGLIAGSGINQDGTSNGLIAPNARAQERLEREVYARFKINPETIQVLEAHATGTTLGDSIEHLAISRVFREHTDRKQFCAVGTVKTNIGHTGPASGMAGLIKLLLALKNQQIPASLHFETENPSLALESSPFYVNTHLQEWTVKDNQVRRGAVSSMGFSGTNAHLIVEEHKPVVRAVTESHGYLVLLSARTPEQLKQHAANFSGFLKCSPALPMNDVSFSLSTGRLHLGSRLAIVARTQMELIDLLDQWIDTGNAPQAYGAEVLEGRIRENLSLKRFGNFCIQECMAGIDAVTYLQNLAAIAELYVKGYVLDFSSLFSAGSRRIPLPTYPFAGERYWVTAASVGKASLNSEPLKRTDFTVLHPLVHANTSNLSQVSYCSKFGDDDMLWSTNAHGSQKCLQEAVILEMARTAIGMASPGLGEFSVLELRDVVWPEPVAVDQGREISISLQSVEGEVDFRVHSTIHKKKTTHCQGHAVVTERPVAISLDLDQILLGMQNRISQSVEVYASLSEGGVHYGREYQVIQTVRYGVKQLVASIVVDSERETRGEEPYVAALNGAFQASAYFRRSDAPERSQISGRFKSLDSLRVLAPCSREMSVWVRYAHGYQGASGVPRLDVDLVNDSAMVCIQMRGLGFEQEQTVRRSAEPVWLFSLEPLNGNHAAEQRSDPLSREEKMECFLKQEAAHQLRLPVSQIPNDVSYFDLGLPSLALTTMVQKLNGLLSENLSPSALFEHKDIRSLSIYLAATFTEKIDALQLIRLESGHAAEPFESAKISPPYASKNGSPISRSERPAGSSYEANNRDLMSLDSVWWEAGAQVDEGYEEVGV